MLQKFSDEKLQFLNFIQTQFTDLFNRINTVSRRQRNYIISTKNDEIRSVLRNFFLFLNEMLTQIFSYFFSFTVVYEFMYICRTQRQLTV